MIAKYYFTVNDSRAIMHEQWTLIFQLVQISIKKRFYWFIDWFYWQTIDLFNNENID